MFIVEFTLILFLTCQTHTKFQTGTELNNEAKSTMDKPRETSESSDNLQFAMNKASRLNITVNKSGFFRDSTQRPTTHRPEDTSVAQDLTGIKLQTGIDTFNGDSTEYFNNSYTNSGLINTNKQTNQSNHYYGRDQTTDDVLMPFSLTSLYEGETEGTELRENISEVYWTVSLRDMSLDKLDLSDFKIPMETSHLDLSYNNITEVSNWHFTSFTNLIYLDLSNNRIRSIENAFSNLSSCEHLNLSSNRLKDIHASMFYGLVSLKQLILVDNLVKTVSSDCFTYTAVLKYLDFSGNPFNDYISDKHRVSLFFSYSLNLMRCEHCNLTKVPLLILPAVSHLLLSQNRLSSIDIGDSYPLLTQLDISFNLLVSLNSTALGNLQYLEKLDVSNNKIKEFAVKLSKSLLTLNISKNLLRTLPPDVFSNLENLRCLSVSHNELYFLSIGLFHRLLKLKMLDLSYNKLRIVDSKVFCHLPSLTNVDISENKICIKILNSHIPTPTAPFIENPKNMIKLVKRMNFKFCNKVELSSKLHSECASELKRKVNYIVKHGARYEGVEEDCYHSRPCPRSWDGLLMVVTLLVVASIVFTVLAIYKFMQKVESDMLQLIETEEQQKLQITSVFIVSQNTQPGVQ